ncbi:hypothetical protein F0562_019753 [Nyssa sinensis]|uniref:DCD domain-containing protein n=1 Tax=Nyssa sinensis TaxID=561372 RepID=A0A5J5BSJ0_9ASTE|nr:hypothetical protein F0562_019753 [Nyssa sinensis]
MELTIQQAKKLIELFRPAEVRSDAPSLLPPPLAIIQDREVYEGAKESWPHSHREPFIRDPYGEVTRYSLLSHENNQHFPHTENPPVEKEEFPRDSFLSEKEYRTYGLRREKHNLTPPNQHFPHREVPPVEKEEFSRDSFLSEKEYRAYGLRRERHNLTPPNQHFPQSVVPLVEQEEFSRDSFLSEREYRAYGLRRERHNLTSATSHISPILEPYPRVHHHPIPTATTTATLDSCVKYPYYTSHYGASSADPYPPTSRREEIPSGSYYLSGSRETYLTETDHSRRRETFLTETDHLRRRETYLTETDHLGKRANDDMERLPYSTYAPSALSNYNQIYEYRGARPEHSLAPVSSHYTLAVGYGERKLSHRKTQIYTRRVQ